MLSTFTGANGDHGNAIFIVFCYPESLLENAPFAQPCSKRGGKHSLACVWPCPPLAMCLPDSPLTCASEGDVLSRQTVGAAAEKREMRPQPLPCGTRAGAGPGGDTAWYLLRLCWMVSRSSVTVRLLPETCRGMYSVCDALGGERREEVRVSPPARH